jgi:predicted DNA-binding transcriptional regulator AlpA
MICGKMTMQKKYLTIQEMIDRYGGTISKGALANWRFKGEGPAYTKIGGRVVYPVEKVEEWEDKRTRLTK